MNLEQFLSEDLQITLKRDRSLEENGLDSLKTVELYVYLNETYPDSDIELDTLFQFKTIGDLIDWVGLIEEYGDF